MLAKSAVIPHLAVSDLDAAIDFYNGTLGLPVTEQSEGHALLDAAGTTLMLYVHPQPDPSERTTIGWVVDDIEAAVTTLADAGVGTERYEGFDQDDLGITPAGEDMRAAWITDPDGHVISLMEEA